MTAVRDRDVGDPNGSDRNGGRSVVGRFRGKVLPLLLA